MADNSNSSGGLNWSDIITSLIGAGGSLMSGALAPRRHPFTGQAAPENMMGSFVNGISNTQNGLANWINQGINFPDATLSGNSPTFTGGAMPMPVGLSPRDLPNTTHFDMAHFDPMGAVPGGQAGANRSDNDLLKTLLTILGAGGAGAGLASLLKPGSGTSSGTPSAGGQNGGTPSGIPGFTGPMPPSVGGSDIPTSPIDPSQLPGGVQGVDGQPPTQDPNAGNGNDYGTSYVPGSDGDPNLGNSGGNGGGSDFSYPDISQLSSEQLLALLGGGQPQV